jgi:hypothetical protein
VNEKEEASKTERGATRLQPGASRSESQEREQIKDALRKERRAVKEGHLTGGYCETEALHKVERKLHAILSAEIEECEAQPNEGNATRKRALQRELAAFSWKPKLVVAANQD